MPFRLLVLLVLLVQLAPLVALPGQQVRIRPCQVRLARQGQPEQLQLFLVPLVLRVQQGRLEPPAPFQDQPEPPAQLGRQERRQPWQDQREQLAQRVLPEPIRPLLVQQVPQDQPDQPEQTAPLQVQLVRPEPIALFQGLPVRLAPQGRLVRIARSLDPQELREPRVQQGRLEPPAPSQDQLVRQGRPVLPERHQLLLDRQGPLAQPGQLVQPDQQVLQVQIQLSLDQLE